MSTPPRSKRLGLPGLRRRGWIIPVAMIAVAAIAYGISKLRTHTYTGQSVVLVTSNPGPRGPGYASEAGKLALSYAGVIEQDDAIIDRVAGQIGRTPDSVRSHFSAVNPTDSALLRLRYRDSDRRRAAAGARAAAAAVAGPHPVSTAIGSDTIRIVRLAAVPKRAPAVDALTLGVGLFLGLLLGIVLLLAWERTDSRIDEPGDSFGRLGLPASSLDTLTSGAAANLVERWARLAERSPPRIALLPASDRMQPVTEQTARRLAALDRHGGVRRDPIDRPPYDLHIGAAGIPGHSSIGEVDTLDSDVRILVARRGVREREVVAVLEQLEQFGTHASWLLLSSSHKRLDAPFADGGPPSEPDAPEPYEGHEADANSAH